MGESFSAYVLDFRGATCRVVHINKIWLSGESPRQRRARGHPTSVRGAPPRPRSPTSAVMGIATHGLLAKAAGLGVGLGGAVGTSLAIRSSQDEGTHRSLTFWYHCLPVYLEYRAVQFRNRDLGVRGWNLPAWTGVPLDDAEADRAYGALHDKHARNVRDLVLKMRGFYFKNAQLLSTRDDFVPRQYLEWCKETQDAAPCEMRPGEARAIAEKALAHKLGLPVANSLTDAHSEQSDAERGAARGSSDVADSRSEIFASWDETPLGVASIGTVHAARLTERFGGQEVCVKVQAPGIERRFRADIKTCIDFCRLAMPQHAPPLEEIERQFLTEFDYRAEAANLAETRAFLLPKWRHKVDVPKPFPELCTKEVLVMSKLPGKKLVDGVRERFAAIAAARGWDAREMEQTQMAAIAAGVLKKRDVDAEARATRRANALLSATDALWRKPRFYVSRALSLLARKKTTDSEDDSAERFSPSPRLVNVGEVLRTLLDVHADEIFTHGVFNGDPHPGNVLLMPDGRLGLIDYGQVKRVDASVRRNYAKLTLAILAEDKKEIARLCQSPSPFGFGGDSRNRDEDVAYRLAMFWNDRDTPDVTLGLNLQEFLDEMEARDPVIKAPKDMVMIARVSMLLRGVANAFNVRLRVAEAWRTHAAALLAETDPDYYLLSRDTKQ